MWEPLASFFRVQENASPGYEPRVDKGETETAEKKPFDIDAVIERLREAVQPFPLPALFQLAQDGWGTPFEILVACIVSIRTFEEVTLPAARALLARARTPEAMVQLAPSEIDALIRPCQFHEPKARQIHEIARRVVAEHDGVLPCDEATLLGFAGVGPKCAHLVLGIACGQPFIGVDIHVHRVANRWGYVATKTPEKTMNALEAKLPRAHWVEINRLLVPWGKHVCTGTLPRCSACPVLAMCQQVQVRAHR